MVYQSLEIRYIISACIYAFSYGESLIILVDS